MRAAPEAILFDLDETLTDRPASLRRFAEVFRATYRERLAPLEMAELERLVVAADRSGGGRQASPGPDRHDCVVAEALARTLPWRNAPPVDELAAYWTAVFPGGAAPPPGLHEMLLTLRAQDIKLGIVTNGVVDRQTPKIDALGLGALVDVVVISEAFGVQKPDRRIFAHALAAFEVRADAAWFVGDNPVADVSGARDAGMTPVWVRRGPWPAGYPAPSMQIDRLTELLSLLSGAGAPRVGPAAAANPPAHARRRPDRTDRPEGDL